MKLFLPGPRGPHVRLQGPFPGQVLPPRPDVPGRGFPPRPGLPANPELAPRVKFLLVCGSIGNLRCPPIALTNKLHYSSSCYRYRVLISEIVFSCTTFQTMLSFYYCFSGIPATLSTLIGGLVK